jgi:hypothetical protein
MAGWRGKDHKSATAYIGTCSMGRDAASEIALERKIADLTVNNLQAADFVFAH